MLPNDKGYFGEFGGKFVPETLMPALLELENAYKQVKNDKNFKNQLNYYFKYYVGRPTPLYYARNLSKKITKAKIYLKREDLAHTGAHKINNTLGQALLAKKMGKKRIIAETGAGQHGVATATVSALFGLKCTIYMGKEDIKRQRLNVIRMRQLGANVISVDTGSKTLKDACNQAIRDWVSNVYDTYYIIGSVVGPHPYPLIVRDFQSIIGKETKNQILKLEKKLPNYLIACVGGGSNAIGMFHPFFKEKRVKFIGVEAAGENINSKKNSASISRGSIGVFQGNKSFVLQDKEGQINLAHSIAPGLDYPGVGPEHSYYKKIKRAEYVRVTDNQALQGYKLLTETEGIIPALEPSHAIYYAKKFTCSLKKEDIVIICLSGRGDKDVEIINKTKCYE